MDELVNHGIRRTMRGYAVAEVDALMARAAERVRTVEAEVDGLRQRLRENETRLATALESEAKVKRAQATAESAAEEALADAREQADELRKACEAEVTRQLERAEEQAQQLITDARQQAQDELAAMRVEHADLIRRLETLRESDQRHRSQLREHLQDQLAALETLDTLPPPTPDGKPEGSEET